MRRLMIIRRTRRSERKRLVLIALSHPKTLMTSRGQIIDLALVKILVRLPAEEN
jgi:hypothetical protein